MFKSEHEGKVMVPDAVAQVDTSVVRSVDSVVSVVARP
jgi:hypothetical protein